VDCGAARWLDVGRTLHPAGNSLSPSREPTNAFITPSPGSAATKAHDTLQLAIPATMSRHHSVNLIRAPIRRTTGDSEGIDAAM
jgi:hypothetical protein